MSTLGADCKCPPAHACTHWMASLLVGTFRCPRSAARAKPEIVSGMISSTLPVVKPMVVSSSTLCADTGMDANARRRASPTRQKLVDLCCILTVARHYSLIYAYSFARCRCRPRYEVFMRGRHEWRARAGRKLVRIISSRCSCCFLEVKVTNVPRYRYCYHSPWYCFQVQV